MIDRVPVTPQGFKKLQEELQHLKSVVRHRVIAAIAEARAHGDLKENAEYAAAREEQSLVEGRIQELESKISTAQVIDVTKMANDGRVIFGATVTLKDMNSDAQLRYQIVGEDEANLKQGKISIGSPLARGLIGKYQDDEVPVPTPEGVREFWIESVEYL